MDITIFDLKLVEIHLKSEQVLTGTINIKANIFGFEDVVPFITIENSKRLNESAGNSESYRIFIGVTKEQVTKFFDFIPVDQIEDIKLVEKEIHTFRLITQNKKEIQNNNIVLEVRNDNKPGYTSIKFKIPGVNKFFDVGSLRIKNGVVEIGVSVAFISYAREDEKTVKKIVHRLNESGVITWFDKSNLLPGSNWEMNAEKNIESADYFLLFLSKETQDRIGYKNRELKLALKYQTYRPEGRVYIIPVLLNDCDLPYELRHLNWLKISEDGWFDKLINAVAPWYVKQNLLLR